MNILEQYAKKWSKPGRIGLWIERVYGVLTPVFLSDRPNSALNTKQVNVII